MVLVRQHLSDASSLILLLSSLREDAFAPSHTRKSIPPHAYDKPLQSLKLLQRVCYSCSIADVVHLGGITRGAEKKIRWSWKEGCRRVDWSLDFEDIEINLLDTERQRAFTILNALSSSTSNRFLDRSHRRDVKTRMAQSTAQTVPVTSPRAGAVAVAIWGPCYTSQLKLSSPDLQLPGFSCRVGRWANGTSQRQTSADSPSPLSSCLDAWWATRNEMSKKHKIKVSQAVNA